MFNGLAFVVICACYGRMYCSIRGGQDAAATLTRADLTVAKRMALLVFTDFACWAPIAFFGITGDTFVFYPITVPWVGSQGYFDPTIPQISAHVFVELLELFSTIASHYVTYEV